MRSFILGIIYLTTATALAFGSPQLQSSSTCENNPRLIEAVKKCDLENVNKLISRGVDVNAQDCDGNTALMFGVGCLVEITDALIAAKVNLDTQNNEGKTALIIATPDAWYPSNAAYYGAKALIDAKANLDIKGKDGNTALMLAVGNVELTKDLISAKANLDLLNKDGRTALMLYALWYGTPEIIQTFADAKANLDIQDLDGNSALLLAATRNAALVNTLINAKAILNLQNKDGHTALMLAIIGDGERYHPEIAKALINAKANLDLQVNNPSAINFSRTALMMAIWPDKVDTLNMLIAAKANLNIRTNQYASPHRTALGLAIDHGFETSAKLIKDAGGTE